VRKVIDTLNDLDHVLWEISNESHGGSTDWQYHMINYVKSYEAQKSKQHPVGMTFQWPNGNNSELYASPAEWISPRSDGDIIEDQPTEKSSKVILTDTDHIQNVGENNLWVWKSFIRGMNPIYMDSLEPDTAKEAARKAMGDTLAYAKRFNLAAMFPCNQLASTGYCLANPGVEYLIYLPSKTIINGHGYSTLHWLSRFTESEGLHWISRLMGLHATVTVDLSTASEPLHVEWFNPATRHIIAGETITGGTSREFVAPFVSDAVLSIAVKKHDLSDGVGFFPDARPLNILTRSENESDENPRNGRTTRSDD
jgi:hypothetical protein